MTESWESEFTVSYVIGDPGLVLGIYTQPGRAVAFLVFPVSNGRRVHVVWNAGKFVTRNRNEKKAIAVLCNFSGT